MGVGLAIRTVLCVIGPFSFEQPTRAIGDHGSPWCTLAASCTTSPCTDFSDTLTIGPSPACSRRMAVHAWSSTPMRRMRSTISSRWPGRCCRHSRCRWKRCTPRRFRLRTVAARWCKRAGLETSLRRRQPRTMNCSPCTRPRSLTLSVRDGRWKARICRRSTRPAPAWSAASTK